MVKRSAHDMGGDAAGPIDTSEHVPTMTERRIDAMMQLLRAKPRAFWRTDENRRTIESLAPETYNTSGYYQKWAYAMRGLLIEKGILSKAEVDQRLAEVIARYRGAEGAPKTASSGGPGKVARSKSKSKSAGAATEASSTSAGKSKVPSKRPKSS